jgi:hypothetical protein
MRKLFAIGTLLLSSAAVLVSPAAASDRNTYVNNQNFTHSSSVPAPTISSYSDRGRFDREERARLELRLREERLERERLARARRDWRYRNSFRGRY